MSEKLIEKLRKLYKKEFEGDYDEFDFDHSLNQYQFHGMTEQEIIDIWEGDFFGMYGEFLDAKYEGYLSIYD